MPSASVPDINNIVGSFLGVSRHDTCTFYIVSQMGLVGAFKYNLVDKIFGVDSTLSRIIYVLVSLAAVYSHNRQGFDRLAKYSR